MNTVSIGSDWQLFLDDFVIARSTGFDRVVHHPCPYGVVIPADKPWETAGATAMMVKRLENGTFIAYYNAMWWDCDRGATLKGFENDRAHHIFKGIAYAESEDGINWVKPNLGLVECPAGIDCKKNAPFPSPAGITKDNNLGVPISYITDLGQYGNVSDPAKRYAVRLAPPVGEGVGCLWTRSPKGYFASELPDFLNDANWRDKLIDSGSEFDPRRRLLHFWDDVNDEWVAMEQGAAAGVWLPSREIARFASKELKDWTAEIVLYPDTNDTHRQDYYDEPMGLTPFCRDGVVYGLLSWFHSDRTHPEGGPNLTDTSKPVGHPDHWPWCRKGTNEIRITISRDGGKTWDRTISRQAWIPHGTEQRSYDRLVIGCLPPITVGDEDWFYCNVIDGDHLSVRNNALQDPYYHDCPTKHQTALYIQKRNRYVSLTTANRKEVLLTKPFVVEGQSLQLNVDASRGSIRVAVISAEPVSILDGSTTTKAPHILFEENIIKGFSFDDCEPVYSDSIEQTVRFKNNADISCLYGRKICVAFEIFDADLYGFCFA